jgi:hypothetical protein
LPVAGRKVSAYGKAVTVEVVDLWTGRHASALRAALRMTNEMFAGTLGTAVRTVAKWNAQPGLVPVPELQRALDTELSRAPKDVQARFALLISDGATRPAGLRAGDDGEAIDLRLTHDLAVGDALRWLDSHAGWPAGEARRRVRLELSALDMDRLDALAQRRGNVGRAELAARATPPTTPIRLRS